MGLQKIQINGRESQAEKRLICLKDNNQSNLEGDISVGVNDSRKDDERLRVTSNLDTNLPSLHNVLRINKAQGTF